MLFLIVIDLELKLGTSNRRLTIKFHSRKRSHAKVANILNYAKAVENWDGNLLLSLLVDRVRLSNFKWINIKLTSYQDNQIQQPHNQTEQSSKNLELTIAVKKRMDTCWCRFSLDRVCLNHFTWINLRITLSQHNQTKQSIVS